eukprot:901714_1
MSDSLYLLYPLQDVFCFPWYWILLFHLCNVIIKFTFYNLFMSYKQSIYDKLPDLMRHIRQQNQKTSRKTLKFEYIDVSLRDEYLLDYQQQFKDSLNTYTNIPRPLQTLIYSYIFGTEPITNWDEFCVIFKDNDGRFYRNIVNILQKILESAIQGTKTKSKSAFEKKISTLKRMKLIATLYTWLHLILHVVWLVLFILFYIDYYDELDNAWVGWILLFCYHPFFSFTLALRYYKTWQYWEVLNNAMRLCCQSTGNTCLPCLFAYLCCPCYGYFVVLARCKGDIQSTTEGDIIVNKYEFNTDHYQMKRIYLTNIHHHKKVKQLVCVFAALILGLCWGGAFPLMMISIFYYFTGYTIMVHLFMLVPFFMICICIYALCRRCIPESIKDDKEGVLLVLFFTFWIHYLHVLYVVAYALHLSSDEVDVEDVNPSAMSAFIGSYCDEKDLYVFDIGDWRAVFLFISWIL